VLGRRANPREVFARLREELSAVVAGWDNWKFPGARQRPTPVVDARGAVETLMVLPGRIVQHPQDDRGPAASQCVRPDLVCQNARNAKKYWDRLVASEVTTLSGNLYMFPASWPRQLLL
jgi:hypothetical protein